jgi:hypothetical protein
VGRVFAGGLLLLCVHSLAVAETEPEPGLHALLVGCTAYPYLDEYFWLQGPENDVALLSDLLSRERFGFDRVEVTALAGWTADESSRPTRKNIAREFRKLAKAVGPGDQVLILLGGHGSQQPADEDPADPEPDGLDEIFLPADVKGWDGEQGVVKNAITDDEIESWLDALRKTGAAVWIIVDACHSGTMTRGAPREVRRDRTVPAEVLVPSDELARARKRATVTRGMTRSRILDLRRGDDALVAMHASQAYETTPELRLPNSDGLPHGLFSYTIAQLLSEISAPLTYRELADQVVARYRARGHPRPTPLVDGGGLDREVLGLEEWPDRPRILLAGPVKGKPRRLLLDAGHLHGLRRGSVLAVWPPAGAENADDLLGYVRVISTEPVRSVVEPFPYDGRDAPDPRRLVAGSRCSVVFVDYGDLAVRVAVQSQGSLEVVTHAHGEGPPELEALFDALGERADPLLRRVADPQEADWFARLACDELCLIPAAGWGTFPSESASATDAPLVPPTFSMGSPGDPQASRRLLRTLRGIARAENLLGLAQAPEPETDLDMQVELMRVEDGVARAVLPGPAGRILRPDDKIVFRVTNRGDAPIDVTLLFVDSRYGIDSVFPTKRRRENRIPPHSSIDSELWTVEADTVGPEQVVAIAVRASGVAQTDFSYLEQPTLLRSGDTTAASPLGKLLEHFLYGQGSVRGLPASDVDEYQVRLLAWYLVP